MLSQLGRWAALSPLSADGLSTANLVAILCALIATAGAVYTGWRASRTASTSAKRENDVRKLQVQSDSYDRARAYDRQVMTQLEEEVNRLHLEIDRHQRLLAARDERIEQQLVSLHLVQETCVRLRRALIEQGIPIPNGDPPPALAG